MGDSNAALASEPAAPGGAQEQSGEPGPRSSGIEALCLIARLHHVAADPGTLAHQLGISPSQQVDTAGLLLAAKHLGLKAKLSRTTADRLTL
ncbi:MAG: type I secretion system permease/ATPase, partial [Aquabacterium sp.]